MFHSIPCPTPRLLESDGRELFVELQVEGSLLVATSHCIHDTGGSVHVWDIGASREHASPDGVVRRHRCRCFDRRPDRVEVRHGGKFLEVCFAPDDDDVLPASVADMCWVDPSDSGAGVFAGSLRLLFSKNRVIADWRCDVRDVVVWVDGEDSATGDLLLCWARMW